MKKTHIMAKYKDGSTAYLYGYPVLDGTGKTIGIVTGDSRRGFDCFRLDGDNVADFHSFRTHKQALGYLAS